MARSFIRALTSEGEVVLDPFSGRGTTLLEARLTGRVPLASDFNPLAVAISASKNVDASQDDVLARIDELERRFDLAMYTPEAFAQPDSVNLIFNPNTLARLCYLRRRILKSDAPVDRFLVGVVLGVMHGNERSDGTSAYLSISMPNTFSMSPEYVRKFVAEKRLQRVDRDVFGIVRDKVKRLFREGAVRGPTGEVAYADAKDIASCPAFVPYRGQVRLMLASPPYLNIVNYAKQNWIRLWFLRADVLDTHDKLDDDHGMDAWLGFMDRVLTSARTMMAPGGVIALVVGDVARASKGSLSPARELIRRVNDRGMFDYVGCLADHFEQDEKVTRIWGDTKGQATSVDRVVVLSDRPPTFNNETLNAEFGEIEGLGAARAFDAGKIRAYAHHFSGAVHTAK